MSKFLPDESLTTVRAKSVRKQQGEADTLSQEDIVPQYPACVQPMTKRTEAALGFAADAVRVLSAGLHADREDSHLSAASEQPYERVGEIG